ncbi:MAG: chemotaxis protein CheW [Pseudomonadota bacterium]
MSATDEQENLRELLTFTLGEEEYCIDILTVREIRGYEAVTRIANTPDFIKGVINLRGNIIPIIDLRLKLMHGEVVYDQFTVVIILNILKRVIGVVVDSVSDVISLPHTAIKPAPEFGSMLETQYILGLATVDDRMLIHIDIEKLMGSRDMDLVADTGISE